MSVAVPAPAARRALLFVAVWGLLVMAWATVARDHLPIEHRENWPPEIAAHAPPLARYDAGWYRRIALTGYGSYGPSPGTASEHVFFPLYPAVVAGVSRLLGADPFAAGMAVSLAALAIAAILFVAEGARRTDEVSAIHALTFLLLFPTAFFLASAYAEALFLLLALLAFDAIRRRAWLAAVCFGFLAGLTRLPALALAAPLAIAAAAAPGDDARSTRLVRGAAIGAAPVIAVFLWIFGIGWYTGEPGLYFRLQESWQRASSPLSGLARWGMALPQRIAGRDLDPSGIPRRLPRRAPLPRSRSLAGAPPPLVRRLLDRRSAPPARIHGNLRQPPALSRRGLPGFLRPGGNLPRPPGAPPDLVDFVRNHAPRRDRGLRELALGGLTVKQLESRSRGKRTIRRH